jgi:hypothetical protein
MNRRTWKKDSDVDRAMIENAERNLNRQLVKRKAVHESAYKQLANITYRGMNGCQQEILPEITKI